MMMLKKLGISLILLLIPTQAYAETSLDCLAKNIYFEAKSESFVGQTAVALVVLNRVMDKRYPNNICDVIYEGPTYESWKTRTIPDLPEHARVYYPRRDRCQFSWYCDGKADEVKEESAYQKAHKVAWLVIHGHMFDFTQGATHYHADYVNPKWTKQKNMIKIVQIDTHIFYRLNK